MVMTATRTCYNTTTSFLWPYENPPLYSEIRPGHVFLPILYYATYNYPPKEALESLKFPIFFN